MFISDEDLEYENILNFGQRIRMEMAHRQIAEGVPTDKDGVELLLKTLGEMDKTALQKQKNLIDSNQGGSNAEIASAMALMIRNQMNQSPFIRDPALLSEDRVMEEPPADLFVGITHAEGETVMGVISETVDEFNARMDQMFATEDDDE
jgi:hypothetical protein